MQVGKGYVYLLSMQMHEPSQQKNIKTITGAGRDPGEEKSQREVYFSCVFPVQNIFKIITKKGKLEDRRFA